MRILFWNINNKPEGKKDVITSLITDKQPDIFFIAESNKSFNLSKFDNNFTKVAFKGSSSGKIVTAFVKKTLPIKSRDYYLNGKIAVCIINYGSEEIAICGVHFWCKINESFNQAYHSSSLRDEIFKICDRYKNVIFIGDFNLLPWDKKMYSHLGFNAIPWSSIVKKDNFLLKGKNKHYYIFNPMWNYLGDEIMGITCGAKGTFRMAVEGHLEWQFLDQVLCSKDLIDKVFPNKIEIITSISIKGIHTDIMIKSNVKGKQKSLYSDHYPIFCNLN